MHKGPGQAEPRGLVQDHHECQGVHGGASNTAVPSRARASSRQDHVQAAPWGPRDQGTAPSQPHKPLLPGWESLSFPWQLWGLKQWLLWEVRSLVWPHLGLQWGFECGPEFQPVLPMRLWPWAVPARGSAGLGDVGAAPAAHASRSGGVCGPAWPRGQAAQTRGHPLPRAVGGHRDSFMLTPDMRNLVQIKNTGSGAGAGAGAPRYHV